MSYHIKGNEIDTDTHEWELVLIKQYEDGTSQILETHRITTNSKHYAMKYALKYFNQRWNLKNTRKLKAN